MGDHEYAWLQYLNGNQRFFDFLLNYGGLQTLQNYLGRDLTIEEASVFLIERRAIQDFLRMHMNFYSSLKFYYVVNDEFLCVHAGINPENKNTSLEVHNKEELVFIRDKFIHSKFLYNGRKIIFGHTAFKRPYVDKYKIGIDTGATYKEEGYGNLSAFNVSKKEFINNKGEVKKL